MRGHVRAFRAATCRHTPDTATTAISSEELALVSAWPTQAWLLLLRAVFSLRKRAVRVRRPRCKLGRPQRGFHQACFLVSASVFEGRFPWCIERTSFSNSSIIWIFCVNGIARHSRSVCMLCRWQHSRSSTKTGRSWKSAGRLGLKYSAKSTSWAFRIAAKDLHLATQFANN